MSLEPGGHEFIEDVIGFLHVKPSLIQPESHFFLHVNPSSYSFELQFSTHVNPSLRHPGGQLANILPPRNTIPYFSQNPLTPLHPQPQSNFLHSSSTN